MMDRKADPQQAPPGTSQHPDGRRPSHAIVRAWQRPTVTRMGRLGLAATLAALAGMGIVVAYLQEFTIIAPFWDDQGYMMLSVRHLLEGYRLYDDIPVFYGPFYYLVRWLLHGPLGLPLTHDGVRTIALALRITTAGVAAWAVYRMTRGAVPGVVAFLIVGAAPFTILPEAGHPQDLGLLLVTALPLLTRAGRPGSSVVGLGLVVAALCMTKVNVGVFAGVAAWMALLSSTATSRTIAVVRFASLVGCVLLPWILLRDALDAEWARLLAGLATAWIAATAVTSLSSREEILRPRHLVTFAAAVIVGMVAIALFALANGSSVRALAVSLTVGAQALTRYFVLPPPLYPWSARVAAAGLVTAIAWATIGGRAGSRGVAIHVAAASKLALGLFAGFGSLAWWAMTPILLSGVTPFAWLILLPGGAEGSRLPRQVLAWVAVLETLQIYPVPGSQVVCGTMPGLLCALVCLGDGCAWLVSLLPSGVRQPVRAATMGIVLAFLIVQTHSALALWRLMHEKGVPLGMPGAWRMRVPERDAEAIHGLVAELQTRCTSFLVFPGVSSLYFWTGSEPPTLDLVPHQTRMISDERFAVMRTALERSSSPCVVTCKGLAERIPDPRVDAWLRGRFRCGRSFASCTVWEHAW